MSAKHTPGPWFYRECMANREHDWTILAGTPTDGVNKVIADVSDRGAYPEEGLANASLIATAPDLLEALAALIPSNLGSLHSDDFDDDFIIPVDMTAAEIRKARAAIAKATGGAS